MTPSSNDTSSAADFTAIQDAASFAARAHRNQLRKDGKTPYIAHVYRVAMTVRHVFGCDDRAAIVAAILHDTIEDTTTDYDDVAERFGSPIADMVAALTKNMALPERQREAEYEARLAAADWRVRLVKLADTYDNFFDANSDRDSGGPEPKHFVRCEKAIRLAQADAPKHALVARAIGTVRSVLDSASTNRIETREAESRP